MPSCGVGLGIAKENEIFVVKYLVDGGPAAGSKLFQIGDEIVAVNGRHVKGVSLEDICEMVSGEDGTFVEMFVRKSATQVARNSLFEMKIRKLILIAQEMKSVSLCRRAVMSYDKDTILGSTLPVQEAPYSKGRISLALKGRMSREIEYCLKRQDDKALSDAFNMHKHHMSKGFKEGTEGILKENLKAALEEFFFEVRSDMVENIFSTRDVNDDGYLDFQEFKMAVQEPSAIEEWTSSSFSLSGLAAAALAPIIDMHPEFKDKEPLRAISLCSDDHLRTACGAVMEGLLKVMTSRVLDLKTSFEAMDNKAVRMKEDVEQSKFSVGTMSCGDIPSFFEGLGERVGFPNLNFMEGMKNDHSSDVEFVTLNYGLRTTPRIEWNTVLNVDKNKEINGRIIPDYRVLLDSPTANRAKTKLVDCEIVATILYTGPMYQIYNMVLRKWPAEGLKALNDNTFATTIHCLVSAVTKISRVTRIHDGLLLYRGLGGVRLPDSFYRASEAGFKCFVEWGFMSTTSHKSIAVQYTGIAKGRSYPTLLQVRSAAVDHGADIGVFSQYPGEQEFLWNPLSLVEPNGRPFVEDTPEGIVTILPVRMNMNVKTMTVEELLRQKKTMHLSSRERRSFKVLFLEFL